MEDEDFRRAFCKGDDGSWKCVEPATLDTPGGRIQVAAGTTFYPGTRFMGFDLVAWLERRLDDSAERCRD